MLLLVQMYLRLCGWPAERISILSTYNGQKHLIRDVLRKRCAWSPLFGLPARVTTVDRYQGQQVSISVRIFTLLSFLFFSFLSLSLSFKLPSAERHYSSFTSADEDCWTPSRCSASCRGTLACQAWALYFLPHQGFHQLL